MQPESTNAPERAPNPETASNPATTTQHGRQHSNHDPQGSLHSHADKMRGTPEGSPRGSARDAAHLNAHADDGHIVETYRLKDTQTVTPPPRDRITEYENALANSARKPTEAPLFEVIKSTRKPEDRSSPVAKLPNGKFWSPPRHECAIVF